jgi:hypothetical protein
LESIEWPSSQDKIDSLLEKLRNPTPETMPVLIRNSPAQAWAAFKRWTPQSLIKTFGDKKLTFKMKESDPVFVYREQKPLTLKISALKKRDTRTAKVASLTMAEFWNRANNSAQNNDRTLSVHRNFLDHFTDPFLAALKIFTFRKVFLQHRKRPLSKFQLSWAIFNPLTSLSRREIISSICGWDRRALLLRRILIKNPTLLFRFSGTKDGFSRPHPRYVPSPAPSMDPGEFKVLFLAYRLVRYYLFHISTEIRASP